MDNLMLLIILIGISIVFVQGNCIEGNKHNALSTENETIVVSNNESHITENV